MTFQDQTAFYDAEKETRGNCLITAYASFLDLNVSDCPQIQLFFDVKKPANFWMQTVELWLKHYGYREVAWLPEFEPINHGHVDYYFGVGKSARGVHHIVIYKDGEMVFDPHPSKTGLLNITEWITLEKIVLS